MIARWWYYVCLGILDLVRLWSSTQHHVIIVGGICLPILLLLGLKRGHVTELRKDLVTSPTGREVTFFSGQQGIELTPHRIRGLRDELPNVAIIIPEAKRPVMMRATDANQTVHKIESVTLYSTLQGDPVLTQLGATLPEPGTTGLVLTAATAKELAVTEGGQVTLVVARRLGEMEEEVTVQVPVVSILESDKVQGTIGYADVSLIDRIERYVRGQRVPEFNWPAANLPAFPRYGSYLFFCRADTGLSRDDIEVVKSNNWQFAERTGDLPPALDALLKPDKKKELKVYEAWNASSRTNRRDADIHKGRAKELEEITEADDIVVGWNEPAVATIGGRQWTLVGLTMRGGNCWLREFFLDPQAPFVPTSTPQVIHLGSASEETLTWPLGSEAGLKLKALPTDKPARTTPPIAVVPVEITAWLASHKAGDIDFDPLSQRFVDRPPDPVYSSARLYTRTIDDVPGVVEALMERNYGPESKVGLISEIHKQDHSLQLLVFVVGTGVFLFGVVTVVSVLLDSTDRKRGTIGILRVMGMSRGGIFASIFIRAAVIGLLAAGLSVLFGHLLALALTWTPPSGSWFATWKPVISVQLQLIDYVLVLVGSLFCCLFGAVWPAWRASRLDPFDAIVEGRFR